MPSEDVLNPCISCGACCAFYRASFYWAEAGDASSGAVPAELTEKLNNFRRVMKGTNQKSPRCIALLGEIGQSIRCSIYDVRASVCRDFPVSWEQGVHNPRCDQARVAWGLPPLPQPASLPEAPKPVPRPRRPKLPRAA